MLQTSIKMHGNKLKNPWHCGTQDPLSTRLFRCCFKQSMSSQCRIGFLMCILRAGNPNLILTKYMELMECCLNGTLPCPWHASASLLTTMCGDLTNAEKTFPDSFQSPLSIVEWIGMLRLLRAHAHNNVKPCVLPWSWTSANSATPVKSLKPLSCISIISRQRLLFFITFIHPSWVCVLPTEPLKWHWQKVYLVQA